jgi:hypothetical protein
VWPGFANKTSSRVCQPPMNSRKRTNSVIALTDHVNKTFYQICRKTQAHIWAYADKHVNRRRPRQNSILSSETRLLDRMIIELMATASQRVNVIAEDTVYHKKGTKKRFFTRASRQLLRNKEPRSKYLPLAAKTLRTFQTKKKQTRQKMEKKIQRKKVDQIAITDRTRYHKPSIMCYKRMSNMRST